LMTRILVVEDEPSISDPLSYLLQREGYGVNVVVDGLDAVEEFGRNGADLVRLDLMLPGQPGTDGIRQSREESQVPCIMLTVKAREMEKGEGLKLGADNYVTKPYSARELIARIRAVMRRDAGSVALVPDTVSAGPVRMDVGRHPVSVDGSD